MITHIAFLRGINVGGHKKIPMAQLRATLTETGLDDVQTYIQSGNVVFQSSEENKAILELKIQNAIAASYVFTFIRQLAMVVQNVIMHSSRKN